MFLSKSEGLRLFSSLRLFREGGLCGDNTLPPLSTDLFSDEFFQKLECYLHLLEVWNKRFNLTRIFRTKALFSESFYTIPFCYANILHGVFSVSPHAEKGLNVWDIGSGNGIPSLFCAMLFPSVSFSLCERDGRKAVFLKEVVRQCELSDTRVFNDDLTRLTEGGVFPCDVVMFRHVSHDPLFLSLVVRLLERGGGRGFFFQSGEAPFYEGEAYKKFLSPYCHTRYKIEKRTALGFSVFSKV